MFYNAEEIGDRIQRLRKEKDITQEYLAYELGVSVNHLSKIEQGIRGTSVDLLIDMSEFFCVSTDYILLGKADKSSIIVNKLHSVATQLTEIEKMIS